MNLQHALASGAPPLGRTPISPQHSILSAHATALACLCTLFREALRTIAASLPEDDPYRANLEQLIATTPLEALKALGGRPNIGGMPPIEPAFNASTPAQELPSGDSQEGLAGESATAEEPTE